MGAAGAEPPPPSPVAGGVGVTGVTPVPPVVPPLGEVTGVTGVAVVSLVSVSVSVSRSVFVSSRVGAVVVGTPRSAGASSPSSESARAHDQHDQQQEDDPEHANGDRATAPVDGVGLTAGPARPIGRPSTGLETTCRLVFHERRKVAVVPCADDERKVGVSRAFGLRIVQIGGLILGHRTLAGGAPPAPRARSHRLRGEAARMSRGGALPVGEHAQGAGELMAPGAQLVNEAPRPFRVGLGHHEALRLQTAQALAQHVGRNAAEPLLQVPEPARPVEQGLHDQERPAIPHAVESGGEGVGGSATGIEFRRPSGSV